MAKKATPGVKSVENAFEVIDALMDLNGAGVSELSDHLGLPKSTVHNYLSTLAREGYLVKDGSTYHIGIRFLEYGAFARARMDVYDVAKPAVDELAETTNELATLVVEEHGHGSYLHRARGAQAVRVDAHVGTRVSLHGTALGKAMLAQFSESRVDDIVEMHGLPAHTPATITSREELEAELEEVRERGVALDDEERLPGLRCVAAPVVGTGDRVLGAVGVSGPSSRIRGDRFTEELPTRILEAVDIVESNVTRS